jgi:hypothetical protein
MYCDVKTQGLQHPTNLPGSEKFDSVLCVRAMDVNFDGTAELLVGTYGQKLLGYELDVVRAEEDDESAPGKFPVYK